VRHQRLVLSVVLALSALACKKKEAAVLSSEQAYVEKEVASLEAALAKGDESGVLVECMATETGLERMPTPLADKIRRLSYAEAPRLMLRNAVADAKKNQGEHPEIGDINCMQLFVTDAFKWMAKLTPVDPEAQKLASEYEQLCPAQANKARDTAAH
jgi:hypothetical protein